MRCKARPEKLQTLGVAGTGIYCSPAQWFPYWHGSCQAYPFLAPIPSAHSFHSIHHSPPVGNQKSLQVRTTSWAQHRRIDRSTEPSQAKRPIEQASSTWRRKQKCHPFKVITPPTFERPKKKLCWFRVSDIEVRTHCKPHGMRQCFRTKAVATKHHGSDLATELWSFQGFSAIGGRAGVLRVLEGRTGRTCCTCSTLVSMQ